MELRKFDALLDAYCNCFGGLDGLSAIEVEHLHYDFDFHLRECLPALQQLAQMLARPSDTFDSNDAKFLFGFFGDGLNHLIAARRLVEDQEDQDGQKVSGLF